MIFFIKAHVYNVSESRFLEQYVNFLNFTTLEKLTPERLNAIATHMQLSPEKIQILNYGNSITTHADKSFIFMETVEEILTRLDGGDIPESAPSHDDVPPPPPPSAFAPMIETTRMMLPAANGATYEQFIANGWTDELLIQNGMMQIINN